MDEATQSFQSLGLSTYEAKALASLFSHHDSTAQDIAQHAEIPYTKIYAILNSLEKQGLLKCTLERPKKYRPLEAESVVSSILSRQEENLKDLKKDAKEHVKLLDKIHSEGATYQRNGAVWFAPTFLAVWDTVHRYVLDTKKDLYVISDGWIWNYCLSDIKLAVELKNKVEKGVTTHAIAPLSFETDFKRSDENWLGFISDSHAMFRLLSPTKIHHNVLIRDDEEMGFSFKKPDTNEIHSGVTMNDKSIVKGSLDYFNMLWNQAMPVENKIREAARKELKRREKEGTIS